MSKQEKNEALTVTRVNLNMPSDPSGNLLDSPHGGARTASQRFMLSALPAFGMTLGLFVAMAGLIAVDFKPAEASEPRLIGTITPQPIEEETVTTRPKIERIEAATQPPPSPRLIVTTDAVDLPVLDFPQVTPEIEPGPIQILQRTPNAAPDEEVLPIRPPNVTYPEAAIRRGIEGDCRVSMDVSAKGRPYNIMADCTDTIFEREAVRAIGRVEFRPKIVDGEAVLQRNIVYPLNFNLQ